MNEFKKDAYIDFKTYRYFFINGIVRINRLTNECEIFINNKFVNTPISADVFEKMANDPDKDAFEFSESPGGLYFLNMKLSSKTL
jgi:hypothetical protein